MEGLGSNLENLGGQPKACAAGPQQLRFDDLGALRRKFVADTGATQSVDHGEGELKLASVSALITQTRIPLTVPIPELPTQ